MTGTLACSTEQTTYGTGAWGLDQPSIQNDVLAIERTEAIDTILDVLRRSTGMRIALVARVTDESWTACAVRDEAGFGIKSGDDLPLRNTY